MGTFLFTAQPAMGHLNPMLAIARQMRADGHDIVFAGTAPPKIQEKIASEGFRCINIRPALSTLGLLLLPLTSGYTETIMAVRLFFSGIYHYANTLMRILQEIQPDAVVADFAFPGAHLAAESAGIPYVIIYHAGLSFKGPGIPPFGSGLPIGEFPEPREKLYNTLSGLLERSVDRAISRCRKRLGLPPNKQGYITPHSSPWLTLALTSEAMEAPRFTLPSSTFFIGPSFTARRNTRSDNFSFSRLAKDLPKIYVSLGTVFNHKPKVFEKIIHAFADGRYQVIISAGRSFAGLRSQRLPANILLFESVPQVEILPFVDVVISHGGNNTVNETLAAGKPLLVMPVGGEQGDNASRVVYLKAGLRANIRKSTPQEIRIQIDRLLEEPDFAKRAKEIAEALAKTCGPITASRFIAHVAQTKQPLHRPEGYPLTVTKNVALPWEYKQGY